MKTLVATPDPDDHWRDYMQVSTTASSLLASVPTTVTTTVAGAAATFHAALGNWPRDGYTWTQPTS